MSQWADMADTPKGADLDRFEPGTHPLEVYAVDLDAAALALEAIESATPRLSPDQISRFEQSKLARGFEDARRWRVAHIALRLALERSVGTALRGMPYEIEPGGRPRINRALRLSSVPHFSLAHAGSVALIGISQIGPLGVDIEVPRPLTVSHDRRQRMVQAAERLAADAPLPGEADARFLQAWVRLEAVAKATGLGIGRILTEAGVVGSARSGDFTAVDCGGCVRDLDAGPGRFAAISAVDLPQVLAVHRFPDDQGVLERFGR